MAPAAGAALSISKAWALAASALPGSAGASHIRKLVVQHAIPEFARNSYIVTTHQSVRNYVDFQSTDRDNGP